LRGQRRRWGASRLRLSLPSDSIQAAYKVYIYKVMRTAVR